jgi:predicted ATPase
VAICREHSLLPHIMNAALVVHGWALVANGLGEEGTGVMRQALAALEAIGAQKRLPYYLALLASAVGRLGQGQEALLLLAAALERAQSTGEHWWDAEILRLRGDLLCQVPSVDTSDVEQCYGEALAVAEAQGAQAFRLRGATSLARLWAEQGDRQKAYDLLAPIYGWFTEGFDTADLKEAQGLLDELR